MKASGGSSVQDWYNGSVLESQPVATLARAPLLKKLGVPLGANRYTGGRYKTHYHSFLEMIVVNADSGVNVVAGRSDPFRRGQVFSLGTFHPHTIETADDEHCDYYNITFHPDALESRGGYGELLSPFYATDARPPVELPDEAYKRTVALCETLVAESDEPDRFSSPVAIGTLLAIIGLVARYRPPDDGLTDPRVQKVLRAISERFAEPLQTRELAEAAGVSSSRLAQLFRRFTGTTVKEALVRRRLTEAKRLLATTAIPITMLLAESGFSDVSYFNRAFRADTGMTPREFRFNALAARESAAIGAP